jgi:hypothetical protein
MRFSWLDLALYLLAIVLLIPLVIRFLESVMKALADTNWGL